MADPPTTGTSSPPSGTAKPPRTGGTDPAAATVIYDKASRSGSNVMFSNTAAATMSLEERDRRIAEYRKKWVNPRQKYYYRSNPFFKMMKGRSTAPLSDACKPDLSVFLAQNKKPLVRPGTQSTCTKALDAVIKYRERKYQNQENEFRVFIEGAEVTSYVEGSISWTIESTGGVNTARFILNNTQDAFIVTPENVCAGPYHIGAWRIPYFRGKRNKLRISTSVSRTGWRVDEVAKWQIYKRKYEAVNPDGEQKQIDSYNGMWLYPLNPFSCIFNRNDAVRIFVRLPHVLRKRRTRKKEWYDLWMPAFTGFIDKYSWTDLPVTGKRTVSINCYDYRALMERMRVRVVAVPLSERTPKPKKGKGKGSAIDAAVDAAAAAAPPEDKEPSNREDYLKPAKILGKSIEKQLGVVYSVAMGATLYARTSNPYLYARDGLFAEEAYIDLHTLWFMKESTRIPKGSTKPICAGSLGKFNISRGQISRAGTHYNEKCSHRVLAEVDHTVARLAKDMTKSLGYVIEDIVAIYTLTGDAFTIKAGVTRAGTSSKDVMSSLKLIPAPPQDVSTVSGKKASVVSLLTSARTTLTETAKGSAKSLAERFKEQALRYYVAKTYLEATAYAGAIAPIEKNNGYKDYIKYLKENGLLATSAEDEKDNSAAAAVRDSELAMKAIEKQVKDKLYEYNNKILKKDKRALGIIDPNSTNKLVKSLIEKKNRLEARLRVLETKSDVNSVRATITMRGILATTNKQITNLKNLRDSPASGKTKSTWRERLGYKEMYPWFHIYGTDILVGEFTLDDIKSRNLGITARARIEARVDRLVHQWKNTYDQPINKASAEAQRLTARAREQLTTVSKDPSGSYEDYVTSLTGGRRGIHVGEALRWMNWKRMQLKRTVVGGKSATTIENVKRFMDLLRQTTIKGKKELKRTKTLPDAILKFAHFETRHAGIFADLLTAVGIQPHPLMDKSYEQAVEYLCCSQLPIFPGVKTKIANYKDKTNTAAEVKHGYGSTALDRWNRIVMFGVAGRPLTYKEVTFVGQGTVTDISSAFSPLRVFYHMLTPKDGTGASTIIQKNTGVTTINSLNVAYETRKKLLDDISSVIDYQYWVSGWGDFIFEFPHYNAFPRDFGNIVKQAYTLKTDWSSATISEESQDIPTAWVLTGRNVDKKLEPGTKEAIPKNYLKTIVIMVPILARRLGVRVENINIRIPGIGGAGDIGTRNQQALEQLRIYGFFHIQRQLGRAHSMQVDMPFRPYVVPNRPIWLTHRQRIGLVRSVTHTMNPPMGSCTTETNIGYTRWMFRDGTFRFIAGGPRQPISYMSFFTGTPPLDRNNKVINPKEGTGDEKKATNRNNTGVSCTGDLATAARAASDFSVAVATQWGTAYSTPFSTRRISFPSGLAVDEVTSGFRVSQMGPSGPSDLSSAQATRATGNPLRYMHNVWKEIPGTRNRTRFESFGFLRRFQEVAYRDANIRKRSSSKYDTAHVGWDLPAGVGVPCLTPIDVERAEASLKVGAWPHSGAKTAWARIKRGGDYSRRSLTKFRTTGGGSAPTLSDDKRYMLIYGEQFLLWRSLGGARSGVKLERGGSGGLRLDIYGKAALPKLGNGGVVQVRLAYIHLSDIKRFNGKLLGGKQLRSAPKSQKYLAKAGDHICWAGTTAAKGSHLHLNMYVKNSFDGDARNEAALRVTLAANQQFIDAQLRARAGFYKKYDGSDPRDNLPKMNEPAAKYWQEKKIRRKLRKGGGKVTVGDVVKYYQKRRTYETFVPRRLGSGGWKHVHAGFFFTRWQVLKSPPAGRLWGSRYKKYAEYRAKTKELFGGSSAKYQAEYQTFCQQHTARAKLILNSQIAKCQVGYLSKLGMGINHRTAAAARDKCTSKPNKYLKAIKKGKAVIAEIKGGKFQIASNAQVKKAIRKELRRLATQGSKSVRQRLGGAKKDLIPAFK